MCRCVIFGLKIAYESMFHVWFVLISYFRYEYSTWERAIEGDSQKGEWEKERRDIRHTKNKKKRIVQIGWNEAGSRIKMVFDEDQSESVWDSSDLLLDKRTQLRSDWNCNSICEWHDLNGSFIFMISSCFGCQHTRKRWMNGGQEHKHTLAEHIDWHFLHRSYLWGALQLPSLSWCRSFYFLFFRSFLHVCLQCLKIQQQFYLCIKCACMANRQQSRNDNNKPFSFTTFQQRQQTIHPPRQLNVCILLCTCRIVCRILFGIGTTTASILGSSSAAIKMQIFILYITVLFFLVWKSKVQKKKRKTAKRLRAHPLSMQKGIFGLCPRAVMCTCFVCWCVKAYRMRNGEDERNF